MAITRSVSIPESAFMLGIGGMGMAPLAIFLAQAGCTVCGADDCMTSPVRSLLEAYDVQIRDRVPKCIDAQALVFSSAFDLDHPLLESSREAGLPVIRRGELLAQISHDFRLLAIAGSHGKTTTTGMLIHSLRQSQQPFNYILGARFRDDAWSPAAYEPSAEWLVAEIDESDGTIEGFSPEATIFVNFDWDHPDRYGDVYSSNAAFERLAARTQSKIFIPKSYEAEIPDNLSAEISTVETDEMDFNQANASLAKAAFRELFEPVEQESLVAFPGIARRQDVLYQNNNTIFVADYAHHPTEISALINYAQKEWGQRIVAVFQPHRYSRTATFSQQFADCLRLADEVILLPVYAASEKASPDGLSEVIHSAGSSDWSHVEPKQLPAELSKVLKADEQSTVLFIGAGDIDRFADAFVADWALRKKLLEGLTSDSRLSLGEPLSKRTTLRVGGPARFFAEPASKEDLRQLLKNARMAALPVFFLGRGSNLIVSDQGYDGLVIALSNEYWRQSTQLDGGRLRVGAGLRLKELCGFAAKEGMGGFEFLEGIPGTVGGSLRMNAGAMGGWIFDVVESVTFVTAKGQVETWPKERFHVGYRNCAELKNSIAIEAVLVSGRSLERNDIRQTMDTYAAKRKESQPREPSAGCIFKNPEGDYAGKLVDELGLKEARNGSAEVSSVHGNFIINRGGASSADVLGLVKQVRDIVHEERGITLEPEVLLLGERWEEVLS